MAPQNPNSLIHSSKGLSVRDWPESEQPRERLLNCGPDSLSDAELLAIFLRVGVKGMTVMDLSRFLLKKFQGLRGLFKASHQELQAVSGLGPAKVATIKALAAVTVRYLAEEMQRGPFIGHSRDVQRLLCGRFRDRDREVFAVVFLDTRHHVLAVEEMFQGTLNSATVFPREIVRRALQLNAAAVVAVHNHPSGNPSPSPDDRQVTRELQRACGLLDISLLDHIVIGGNDCFSFAEHRLL